MTGDLPVPGLNQQHGTRLAIGLELAFLILFIVSRIWLFISTYGIAAGWDVRFHTSMLHHWPWDAGQWDIASSFYAYHPPLAFILQKAVFSQLGNSIASIQLVSAVASITGFLFLRATLQSLGILHTWCGVCFLYLISCIPMQLYLAHSINNDVIIYAQACAVLYFSVRLFYTGTGDKPRRTVWSAWLLFWLVSAIFTKYSGLLLLALPALLALARSWPSCTGILRPLIRACIIAVIAVALAFPYYYSRYYTQVGLFFPTNMNIEALDLTLLDKARKTRDKDMAGFAKELFWGTSQGTEGLQHRDQKKVRLYNTWKDFWSGNKHNVYQTASSLRLSMLYSMLSIAFMATGVLYLLAIKITRWTDWDRIGCALVIFSLVMLVFMVRYSFMYPHPLGIPNKGIYIAPAMLGMGYLITNIAQLAGAVAIPPTAAGKLAIVILLEFLVAAMALNAVLPVY